MFPRENPDPLAIFEVGLYSNRYIITKSNRPVIVLPVVNGQGIPIKPG